MISLCFLKKVPLGACGLGKNKTGVGKTETDQNSKEKESSLESLRRNLDLSTLCLLDQEPMSH